MPTPKRAVLVLPDVGLPEEKIESLAKEFQNQILATLIKAGAAADTQVENHIIFIP